MITGKSAEELFVKVMEGAKESTKEENMNDHIDFHVGEDTYDVKGHKRYDRSDSKASDTIWLETVNVRGDKGWLYGKAKFIAFLVNDEFWMIPRTKLVDYVERTITNPKIYNYKGYKKWYRRKGRLDCITYVYPRDIERLTVKKIKV